jgi:transposase
MADSALVAESVGRRYAVLRPHLDERQRRLLLGTEAAELGRGGVKAVAEATGAHPDTVARGKREVEGQSEPQVRVRAPGGGRKKLTEIDPELVAQLKALVDPETRGDPMSLLVWTTKSTKKLAAALAERGHPVSDRTVARMLRAQGFSLQANTKVTEGRQHEDRDAQFRYLAEQVAAHALTGQPVISVDAKKKELVGAFKNGGREYQPSGQPEQVNVHDFPDKELGKAIPYGIYDVSANTGWVTVGTDHDTSAFAVATLHNWWDTLGRSRYPAADRLLICADGGGSNGSRVRAWKIELAAFAADTGLHVTVCHLPPGTSKWNKIRAPAVQPDHHELARPNAEDPPDHRRPDQRHHHRDRPDGALHPRYRPIPNRDHLQRQGRRRSTAAAPRLPRRMELHPAPQRHAREMRSYFVARP